MTKRDAKTAVRAALEGSGIKATKSVDRLLDAVEQIAPELLQDAARAKRDHSGAPNPSSAASALSQMMFQFHQAGDDESRVMIIDTIGELFLETEPTEDAKELLRRVIAGRYSKPVSSAAARALAISRDEKFLARVRTSLESQNLAEVHLAACMVGFARDVQAVPALTALLRPDCMAIFDAVIWALGEIGARDALPLLHFLLETQMFTAEVVEALGKIGDETSLPALLQTLVADDEETRAQAGQAIVRLIGKVGEEGGHISAELAEPTRAILERVVDRDDSRLSRYFAMVAFAMLGGRLHPNRVLGALGAVLPDSDLSPMSAFFAGSNRPAQRR